MLDEFETGKPMGGFVRDKKLNDKPCNTCSRWTYRRTVFVKGCEDAEVGTDYGWCSMHGLEMAEFAASGCFDHSDYDKEIKEKLK